MTFKNGFKEYLFMGVSFGVIYSLFIGFSKFLMGDEVELSYIITLAVLTGVLFGALMALVLTISNNKFIRMRPMITQNKQVICDGPCTYRGKGGWLLLAKSSLEFYVLGAGNLTGGLYVFVGDIVLTKASFNRLTVFTAKGEKFVFVVNKAKKWRQLICSTIGR